LRIQDGIGTGIDGVVRLKTKGHVSFFLFPFIFSSFSRFCPFFLQGKKKETMRFFRKRRVKGF
jgi:hypothetical protein